MKVCMLLTWVISSNVVGHGTSLAGKQLIGGWIIKILIYIKYHVKGLLSLPQYSFTRVGDIWSYFYTYSQTRVEIGDSICEEIMKFSSRPTHVTGVKLWPKSISTSWAGSFQNLLAHTNFHRPKLGSISKYIIFYPIPTD